MNADSKILHRILANRNQQYTLYVMRMALYLCGLPPQKSEPQNNKKSIS